MKVLLIRLSALGDLVIMTSALEYLKERAEITLITRRKYFGLFDEDTRIKQLIDEREIKFVKNQQFDIACDLHAKPKTMLILQSIKAKKKCVINKNAIDRRLAVWFKKRIEEKPLYKLFVKPFHKIFKDNTYPLPVLHGNFEKLKDLPEKYITVFPGASQPYKRWPLEYFVEVSKKIYEEYELPSVYMGTENFKLPEEAYIINKMGNRQLKYLMNAIKFAHLSLSNDSGPAHMSAALTTPLIVIFGPTIPEFGFRPVSRAPVKVIERKDLLCRPCSLHGEKPCKFSDLRCLKGIKPEYLLKEAQLLLRT